MMSLFSSFDLMFFYSANFLFIFFLSMSLNFIYFKCSTSNVVNTTSEILSSFFYSLKIKSFNKISTVLFLVPVFMIFLANFFSVFPFNFPLSSQFSVVFFGSMVVWGSMILFNAFSNISGFVSHLIPEGTPIYLTFLLFMIELISNFIRPLTLTVRLVANILAGHLLLILLSKLVLILPFVFPLYMLLNLVEFFVSIIQAYIFTTMIVLYFSEIH